MNNHNVKYLAAENFMCFGPEGIELDLEKMGRIILVEGTNWQDINPITGKPGSNGTGKCFARNTSILMYDGTTKPVQEIKVGDLVMGDDSRPRKVLSTHAGVDEMYEISPTKGDSYVVNSQHTLCLKSRDRKYDRYKDAEKIVEIDVCDYIHKSKTWKHLHGGIRSGVDFPHRPVKLDPYFLGLWLGDGTTGFASVTTADPEIDQFLVEFASKHGLVVRRSSKANTECKTVHMTKASKSPISLAALLALKLRGKGMTYVAIARHLTNRLKTKGNRSPLLPSNIRRHCQKAIKWIECEVASLDWVSDEDGIYRDSRVNPIKEMLEECGVLHNKHVPQDYKSNDRSTRLEILAGLIDSDGSPSGKGYDFISKIETLSDDVCFLARSLGLAAYKKKCIKKDQNGVAGIYYRVSINGKCDEIPVRVPRKRVEERVINKDVLNVGISINPVGEGEYFGFETDGNHRFLLGDFTIVHNSSIQDILAYGFFGRITRDDIKVASLIHKTLKKKMRVEVRWDKYRVVRTRKPDSLHLWESEDGVWDDATEITCGAGMVETQKKIEAILGMNYKSFVGITVFDDRNDHAFLEMDTPTKRMVIENLLSLEKYREYNKFAKVIRSNADNAVKMLAKECDAALTDLERIRENIARVQTQKETWKQAQFLKLQTVVDEIKSIQSQIEAADVTGEMKVYESAREKILALNESVARDADSLTKIHEMKEKTQTKVDQLAQELASHQQSLVNLQSELKELNQQVAGIDRQIDQIKNLNPNVTCGHCYGIIDLGNSEAILAGLNQRRPLILTDIEAKNAEIESVVAKRNAVDGEKTKISQIIRLASDKEREINSRISDSRRSIQTNEQVKRPEVDHRIAVLSARLHDYQIQKQNLTDEVAKPSPYDQILADFVADRERKEEKVEKYREKIKDAEKMLPYFKFWVDAFGDDGIRKLVIDEIIPTLNAQIAYWLDILIYGNMKLTFDNMFEPTIERVPFVDDPFVYPSMSGGERRRMNLSLIHAFAHIQMLNCGSCPSLLFLDEVVTNIDTNGKQAAFDMIQDLANNRQVFLTTHDPELLDLLQGCQTLKLERRDGITKLVA